MPTSTVMDGNSFSATGTPAGTPALPAADRELIDRRRRVLGPSYRLFYRRPVHLVRAAGTRVFDDEGRDYLDAYNNVASIGHAHPAVVEAVHRQMTTLNTHSRYLQRGIVDYAERLLDTVPGAGLDVAMFTNSGSEANDLALRIARHATGGTGIVVTAEAYHGTTSLLSDVSPALGAGVPLGAFTATVPAPDAFREGGGAALGLRFAADVTAAFERLRARGIRPAALLLDTIFASDGVLDDPAVLGPALEATHRAGAVMIADEVQPGFARTGSGFWGFARHGIVPDLVTLGKPMGNGVPVGGVLGRRDLMDGFGHDVPYFNTFGGSSVPIAAAAAVLDTIRDEGLACRSDELGQRLRREIRALATWHPTIGDVRGAGLFLGVEVVHPGTRAPDDTVALDVVNTMRELGVLISIAGPHNSVLKIRPSLVYGEADLDRLVTTLDEAFALHPGPR